MRYKLFDFQRDAVEALLKKMDSMQRSYEADGSLSAVSLTAPTGAGKTVISAAVAEGLFFGNDVFPGDDRAAILWLSDSPSLNEQTMQRFDAATDLLSGAAHMESIGPNFAKNHRKLMPGVVYFLNRQLLGKGKKLSGEDEGGRSFFDVLNDTIEDDDIHLYLFIDEAHRGLGKGADGGTSDSANRTIYSIIIDGQEGINKPMPCVVGISATPENYNKAMQGRKNRDLKAGVDVPVSAVRESGIIKETIELRTPKKSADTKHQDLTRACRKLAEASKLWKDYCVSGKVLPVVVPLMVVQVEDKITNDTLTSLCVQIHKILPWLDISDCFANVFGEHEDIATPLCKVPYVKPNEVSECTNIRVLFAKDAVSTGWDCPRAEVIYSRRRRTDATYIAQLIGRMIRTPLARRIETVEELNNVACYLPEFDSDTVNAVIERLKKENIATEPNNIIKNPANVSFFGGTKTQLEKKLEKKQTLPEQAELSEGEQSDAEVPSKGVPSPAAPDGPYKAAQTPESVHQSDAPYSTKPADEIPPAHEFTVEDNGAAVNDNEFVVNDDEFAVNDEEFAVEIDDIEESEEELKDAIKRLPDVDPEEIRASFEGIITRQVRHDKPDPFLDLWDCVDIITSDVDPDPIIWSDLQERFYNNIEGEIRKHPAEFKRTLGDIKSTTVAVKRVDPLTGEEFGDLEEQVENDAVRLTSYYKHAVSVFAGASDMVKFYINSRMSEENDSDTQAIARIAAVGYCMEIIHPMELWAENETGYLMDKYSSQRYMVTEDNKERWDRIEGNSKPYIERNLNIRAGVTRQNKDYDRYEKHIITAEDGWAYLNLNELEKKIVDTELDRAGTKTWYRNQSRNLNASLAIPYMLNGEWENMYPDFIFFSKTPDGIKRRIVDPHGDWLGDSVAKLKGYVAYIKDHPDMFSAILAVTQEKGGEYRYLDLMLQDVQDAIEIFTGTSAKELFTGKHSKRYHVKEK